MFYSSSDVAKSPNVIHPIASNTAGLNDIDGWRGLLSPFSHIILVANSGEINIGLLQKLYPDDSLFVFFNKAYKILSAPFHGNSLLVSRGTERGANIVYRDEVDQVIRFFQPSNFLGILNIRLNTVEKLNKIDDFNGAPVGHLDLSGFCAELYPENKTPTTGFAMAVWLADQKLPGKIVLAGFSARRSERWRVVSIHDWNFEQVFLRLFARTGLVTLSGGPPESAYTALSTRFPQIPQSEILLTITEVLSERLSNANSEIDKLISLTNFIRAADTFIRGIRPKFLKRKRRDIPPAS